MLEGCTPVEDGCEVEAPQGAKALSYFRETLWVTSDSSLTRIQPGKEATAVRDVQTNVAGDFAVTESFAFVGTMIGVAPKPVLRAFPIDGGDALDLGATTGVAFGDCVVRDGDQVVWTAGAGNVSLLGMVQADGSRPVDLGAVQSPRRAKGMPLVAPDGDHAFIASANRVLHAEVTNLTTPTELWKGAEGEEVHGLVRDSDRLYFVVDGRLSTMSTRGGPPRTLADIGSAEHLRIADGALVWRTMQFANDKRTATWWSLPTTGGTPRPVLTRESETGAYTIGGGQFFALARSRSSGRDVIVRSKP